MRADVLVLTAAALCVSACTKQSTAPAPVAAVGAQPISQGLFDYYVSQKAGAPADKVDAKVKDSLSLELKRLKAAADAEESKADAGTQQALEVQRLELLAHAGAVGAGVYAAPSDADLKDEYARYIASLPAREFHVAHILVATESAAQILVTKLQGGTDFAKLAREQSADDSKAKGGDLGWIAPGKLPVDFTDAIQALKPGQITMHPVHTIYGWHVIKMLESRSAAVPPFDQVKAQLAANLEQARYKQFLESALTNSKISQPN